MGDKITKKHREYVVQKAEMLKAISHPVRLCLTQKLCEYESCNVSFLIDCMGVSQSSISQHLAKLRDIGIISYHKDGQNVNYYLKNEEIRELIHLLFSKENNEE